jgi:hypothetical protein
MNTLFGETLMKNEKMFQTRDDKTKFYKKLISVIEKQGYARVKLRHDTIIDIVYYKSEGDLQNEGFHDKYHNYCWYNDGTSSKNAGFDIVELLKG